MIHFWYCGKHYNNNTTRDTRKHAKNCERCQIWMDLNGNKNILNTQWTMTRRIDRIKSNMMMILCLTNQCATGRENIDRGNANVRSPRSHPKCRVAAKRKVSDSHDKSRAVIVANRDRLSERYFREMGWVDKNCISQYFTRHAMFV